MIVFALLGVALAASWNDASSETGNWHSLVQITTPDPSTQIQKFDEPIFGTSSGTFQSAPPSADNGRSNRVAANGIQNIVPSKSASNAPNRVDPPAWIGNHSSIAPISVDAPVGCFPLFNNTFPYLNQAQASLPNTNRNIWKDSSGIWESSSSCDSTMVPECYPNYFTTATKMIDGTQVNYDNHNFIWMKGDWKDLGLCEEYSDFTNYVDDQVIGISADNTLSYTSLSDMRWQILPGPVRALDLVQLPDASFLVVGTDYQLYTCPGLSLWFTCTQVPNSGSVKSIEYAPRGNKFIGVGLDDQVYIRIGLLSPWNLVPNSGRVVDVTLLTNGVLLGTTWDGTMWTKADQESQWIKVPNGCCVLRTSQLISSGTILGVGVDLRLYQKVNLQSPWTLIPNSNSVINAIPFTTMPLVNLLVGIGPDNSLWGKRADALTSPWTQIPSTMPILDLIEVHGTYMIVGTDNKLYFCTSLYINSQCEKQLSGQIKSIAYDFDADQIIGVGMDNQLYVYDHLSWTVVPKSGSVWDISIRNGVIVGVGTDMNVYTRAGLYSPWVLARGFCCVTRVAVLPNGRYGGVGPDYAIYEANPTWTSLPGSKAVVNFANLIHY